jgi:hypothetical protein
MAPAGYFLGYLLEIKGSAVGKVPFDSNNPL